MEEKSQKKNLFNNTKNIKKVHKIRIKGLITRVSTLAILLIVSTYAWFTSQKDITLSNIRGTVEVVENMEISLDAKTWYQKIDLSDAETVFTTAQESRDEALGETDSDTKSTALAILPEQLFPVSGVGKTGTGVTILPLYAGEATSTSLSLIAQCLEEETDLAGKDVVVDNGYIAFDMYIKNTSRDSENDVLQLNINSSAQVLTETISKTITDVTGNRVNREYTGNDASGLQNTIRVALAKYGDEVSSTSTQLEILNATKGASIEDIAIWEPNAYDHVETIVSNNNKLINGSNTEKIEFTAYHPSTPLETYALSETAVNQTIENVYDITSTGLEAQNTFKTDNIKDADDKIESYRIKTTNNKPLDIKNTSNNNFEISSNAVTRYRVYIWLEGQDIDCINVASLGGGIELDLGLTKDNEVGKAGEELGLEGESITTAITNANIGDYIDLGNSIVGTSSTKDDWRVLYVEDTDTDGQADKVHVILSDYLLNSTGHAIAAGLNIPNSYTYSVNSTESATDLENKLNHQTAWDSLSNGKSSDVVGSPTQELLESSLNAMYGTTDFAEIEDTAENYDLYMPHTEVIDGCQGYWLAQNVINQFVGCVNLEDGVSETLHSDDTYACRPVVTLTSEINVANVNGVWKVVEELADPVEPVEESLATKISEDKAENYGLYTDYPVDIDGDSTNNDWRIFYSDDTNVFLIADDYVKNDVLTNNEMNKVTGSLYKNYSSNFGANQLTTTSIVEETANKYLLREAVAKADNNYYATAHLLNTNVWNTYFKDSVYAESAVGGPTVEMFIESWNEKVDEDANYSKLSYAWGTRGYLIGTTTANNTSVTVNGFELEKAEMYWPHPNETEKLDGTDSGYCRGYWLASPADQSEWLLGIEYNGLIDDANYAHLMWGIRNVVSLKTEITANKVGDVWELGN